MGAALAAASAIAGLVSTAVGLKQAFSKPKTPSSPAPTTPTQTSTAAQQAADAERSRVNAPTRYGLLQTGPQGLTDEPNLGRFKLLGS